MATLQRYLREAKPPNRNGPRTAMLWAAIAAPVYYVVDPFIPPKWRSAKYLIPPGLSRMGRTARVTWFAALTGYVSGEWV